MPLRHHVVGNLPKNETYIYYGEGSKSSATDLLTWALSYCAKCGAAALIIELVFCLA